jgi:3-dehydroquinate synthase
MSTVYSFQSPVFQTHVEFRPGIPSIDAHAASVVVCDPVTHELYCSSSPAAVVVAARDASKEWASVAAIIAAALERGADRDTEVVAIGGGAVCDVGAFAASILLRGVGLTLVPTTLTCMVDAALGGKTGINFGQRKNMVGTFYPAKQLLIYPQAVATLSERDYRSGLAEVIKTALLGDAALTVLLETRQAEVTSRAVPIVTEMVRRCVAMKGALASADLREEAQTTAEVAGREVLNLGHTFGHALESASGFTWTHGEAVAWGIGRATLLARHLEMLDAAYAQRVWRLLAAYGFALHQDEVLVDDLLVAMRADKKRRGQQQRFVLQRGPGANQVVPVADADIRVALERSIADVSDLQ